MHYPVQQNPSKTMAFGTSSWGTGSTQADYQNAHQAPATNSCTAAATTGPVYQNFSDTTNTI